MKKAEPDSPADQECNPQLPSKGVLVSFYPKDVPEAMIVVYDLRDPAQWTGARRDREAWGRERSEIHPLDNDHVAIEFRAGGALGLEASA